MVRHLHIHMVMLPVPLPGLLALAALQSLMVSPHAVASHTGLRVAVRMHTERAASSLSLPAFCADPPTILPPALLTPQGPPRCP